MAERRGLAHENSSALPLHPQQRCRRGRLVHTTSQWSSVGSPSPLPAQVASLVVRTARHPRTPGVRNDSVRNLKYREYVLLPEGSTVACSVRRGDPDPSRDTIAFATHTQRAPNASIRLHKSAVPRFYPGSILISIEVQLSYRLNTN